MCPYPVIDTRPRGMTDEEIFKAGHEHNGKILIDRGLLCVEHTEKEYEAAYKSVMGFN